ncbi:MAG: hypothetical protein RBT74_13085 [Tenuifilaceae bacterium]|nr:hypothetical protein [Tenuifilaceae bacterium]
MPIVILRNSCPKGIPNRYIVPTGTKDAAGLTFYRYIVPAGTKDAAGITFYQYIVPSGQKMFLNYLSTDILPLRGKDNGIYFSYSPAGLPAEEWATYHNPTSNSPVGAEYR